MSQENYDTSLWGYESIISPTINLWNTILIWMEGYFYGYLLIICYGLLIIRRKYGKKIAVKIICLELQANLANNMQRSGYCCGISRLLDYTLENKMSAKYVLGETMFQSVIMCLKTSRRARGLKNRSSVLYN